jgi:hypothetical protein
MAMVAADVSVAVDGFVADASGRTERVFAWSGRPGRDVYGRRTIAAARGWGGNHPARAPVIVVRHSVTDAGPGEESTMSVTGAIESAI